MSRAHYPFADRIWPRAMVSDEDYRREFGAAVEAGAESEPYDPPLVINRVPCPTCDAAIGERCYPETNEPHYERSRLYMRADNHPPQE